VSRDALIEISWKVLPAIAIICGAVVFLFSTFETSASAENAFNRIEKKLDSISARLDEHMWEKCR
jgi:hypothetical protein